jgi:putative aminopeptidase
MVEWIDGWGGTELDDGALPLVMRRFLLPSILASLLFAVPASGQGGAPPPLVARFAAFSAVTGYEQAVVDTLINELLPGSIRDRSGSAVLVLGSGAPRRLVACPLDEPGWVVGSVEGDGYLTLRRAPGRLPSPLFDQQLEGHRITLFGRWGPVPGVVGVRSIHLTRGRDAGADAPFSVDDARVDVGASRATGARALGVDVLTPVSLAKKPQRYGTDLLAAPMAGRRAACAALVLAAREAKPGSGTVVVAFVTEQNLSQRGLRTVRRTQGPFTEELVIDGGAGAPGPPNEAKEGWFLPAAYATTPVETVSLAGADSLRSRLGRWIAGTP